MSKGKANAQGWIRHNRKTQPVNDGVVIEIRTRDGAFEICEARGFDWSATGGPQIMAYRIIQPEQHAIEKAFDMCVDKCASTEPGMPAATPIDGPLQWLDRINEIDRTVEALEEERVSLVQRLADEGLQLIGKRADCVELLPREDWRVGDLVVRVFGGGESNMPLNQPLPITHFDGSEHGQDVLVDDSYYPKVSSLRWHSRPSK